MGKSFYKVDIKLAKNMEEKLRVIDEEEERNYVYIYKTLRYPPRSTPSSDD